MITQHERLLLSRSNQPFIAHGGHTRCAVWGRMTNKTIGLALNTTQIKAQQHGWFTLMSHSSVSLYNVGPNGVH